MKILKRLVLLFLASSLITANAFAGFEPPIARVCEGIATEKGDPISLEITTNAHLAEFDSLLKYLSNHNVVELHLSWTNINDAQLTAILNQIGGNLRTLSLEYCYRLNDFEAIRNWAQERNINLIL